MDGDELIDQILADAAAPDTVGTQHVAVAKQQQQGPREDNRVQEYRERLAATVAGGSARKYGIVAHGKALTIDQVEELSDSEVERLYARYSARLGADMSKKISNAALGLYAGLVGMFILIPDDKGLFAILKAIHF